MRNMHKLDFLIAYLAGLGTWALSHVMFAWSDGLNSLFEGVPEWQSWGGPAIVGLTMLTIFLWSMSSYYRRITAETRARILEDRLHMVEDHLETEARLAKALAR